MHLSFPTKIQFQPCKTQSENSRNTKRNSKLLTLSWLYLLFHKIRLLLGTPTLEHGKCIYKINKLILIIGYCLLHMQALILIKYVVAIRGFFSIEKIFSFIGIYSICIPRHCFNGAKRSLISHRLWIDCAEYSPSLLYTYSISKINVFINSI